MGQTNVRLMTSDDTKQPDLDSSEEEEEHIESTSEDTDIGSILSEVPLDLELFRKKSIKFEAKTWKRKPTLHSTPSWQKNQDAKQDVKQDVKHDADSLNLEDKQDACSTTSLDDQESLDHERVVKFSGTTVGDDDDEVQSELVPVPKAIRRPLADRVEGLRETANHTPSQHHLARTNTLAVCQFMRGHPKVWSREGFVEINSFFPKYKVRCWG